MTALRGLRRAARRDVDRERDDATRIAPSRAKARPPSPASGSSSATPGAYDGLLQRDREPAPLVRPALALGARARAEPRRRDARRLARGLPGRSTRRSPPPLLPSLTTSRMRSSSSTTTTSISRRASCAMRARTRCSRTSSTSRGPPTGASCRRELREAIHDGLLANDVVGFHTARWARNFEHVLRRPRPDARRPPSDLRRCARVRRARAQRSGSRARARPRQGSDREADRARSTAPIRRRTSCAGSRRSGCCSTSIPTGAGGCRCSRCSTRRGRASRSTSSTSRRSSARRPR